MRPPAVFASAPVFALAALVTPAACGGADSTGVEVTVMTAADAPQPSTLRLSWWNETSALILDQHERIEPRLDGDEAVLATLRISVDEAPARRWVVVRGMGAADEVVSEGAAKVVAGPGRWVHVVVRLQPGALGDDDRDGVPDIVDECRGDRTRHSGCPADAGARPDARDAEPDAAADPVDARPADAIDGRTGDHAGDAPAVPDAPATPDATDASTDAATGDGRADADRDVAPDGAADVAPCKAVLAIARGDLTAPDLDVQSHLKALGCLVTIKSDETLVAGDIAGHDLVVVGATAGSTAAYTWLREHAVPLLVLEDRALAPLRMTGATEDTHYGPARAQTAVDVIAESPFSAGLSGKQTVIDPESDITWGAPPADAIRGVTVTGNVARLVVFGFETNAMMVDMKAPARRAAFLIEQEAIPELNTKGWKLFDAAVSWLLGR